MAQNSHWLMSSLDPTELALVLLSTCMCMLIAKLFIMVGDPGRMRPNNGGLQLHKEGSTQIML